MDSPLPALIDPLHTNMIRSICQHLTEVLDAQSVVLGLVEPTRCGVGLPGVQPRAAVEALLPPQARGQIAAQFCGTGLQADPASLAIVCQAAPTKDPAHLSWAAAPVHVESDPPGLLLVTRDTPFEARHIRLLTGSLAPLLALAVQQAWVAIENAQASQALAQRLTEMTVLHNLAQKASATLDLQEVLQTIVVSLHNLLNTYAVSIMLLDKEGSLHLVATVGLPEEVVQHGTLKPGQGVGGRVVETGQTIYIPDVRSDERHVLVDPALRSLLVVPLLVKGRVIGTLSIDSQETDAFGPDVERLLTIAAAQAAIAIENARLYQDEHRRADELNTLMELSRSITQYLEVDQIFTAAHRSISRLMPSEAFHISLRDRSTGETIATYLIDKDVRYPPVRLPVDAGLSGWVIRTGQHVFVNDVHKDLLPFQAISYGDKEHIRAVIAVPLRFGSEVTGVVSTQSYRANAYTEHNLHLLQTIADHIAVAFENAELYSDLQKRYLSLQELDRVRVEFTQNVSHELRTPLTFLRAYVDLLLEDGLGELNDRQRQSLKIVQAKTATLVRLVEDITTLESSGKDWLFIQEVHLIDVARDAIILAEKTAAQQQIQIELQAPLVFPPLQADAARIAQVFDNLLGNALKFGLPGSKVIINLQTGPEHVLVSVFNQGEGIPKREQDRVFERFYQVDGSASRRHGGIGLGLAIVKHIVEAHGGKVWVESEEGMGSTFYFTLPYRPAPENKKGQA